MASAWMVVVFIGFVVYAWRDGQFKGSEEDLKYLLEED
jgi:hypothetical protein